MAEAATQRMGERWRGPHYNKVLAVFGNLGFGEPVNDSYIAGSCLWWIGKISIEQWIASWFPATTEALVDYRRTGLPKFCKLDRLYKREMHCQLRF